LQKLLKDWGRTYTPASLLREPEARSCASVAGIEVGHAVQWQHPRHHPTVGQVVSKLWKEFYKN